MFQLSSWRRSLLSFSFALAISPLAAAQSTTPTTLGLPDIGEASDALLSTAAEEQLGEAFMRRLRQSIEVIDDPEMNDYIQALGNRLATAADAQQGQTFKFFLVNDPAINAFAGPGGYIGIHTGLILAATTEQEVAGVLAHEMAHITQRHIYRRFDRAQNLSLPVAAATIAALLIGVAGGGSDAGIALASAAQASSIQDQINFTRSNEQEADRIGLRILALSGFDPHAMPSFFERLQRQNRLFGDGAPEFLRTHPVTTNRIADSRSRADQYDSQLRPDSLEFGLIRAKIRVAAARDDDTALAFFDEVKENDPPARRYGLALAQERAKQHEEALTTVEGLLSKDQDRINYRMQQARLLLKLKRPREAFAVYELVQDIYPNHRAMAYAYPEALMRYGQIAQAREFLETYLKQRPAEPNLHRLLARASTVQGDIALGHSHLAEAFYLTGYTREAIQQLETALKVDDLDFFLASKLGARLRQLKQEWLLANEQSNS